jgi:uncharacterized surface protein with fasciclin (FAS1) repeats
MTSFNSPVSIYSLCSETVNRVDQYEPSSVMSYIYRKSPLFALILQRAGLDRWIDAETFNGTVFVPCYEYSSAHIKQFENIDRAFARSIVDASVIRGRITGLNLSQMELIPTKGRQQISVKVCKDILLNEMYSIMKPDIICRNGVIHIINGLIQPTC